MGSAPRPWSKRGAPESPRSARYLAHCKQGLRMRWWKLLGLAGFVGVAATGVVIVRAERRRRAYTPEQIRERLHARLAEASGTRPA
jgi:hypothetical protein